ncbi:hypothetical protein WN55_04747 [Dufourea novaeangliae]|uniref:Uncharacterized protein n=1 Tax=Dufourea novaeangliae TaxID=178035 RepID=A0A154P1S8_DUFNO|nr:hypothetical protein WN55_04747 [Dufourea novaeangliae]
MFAGSLRIVTAMDWRRVVLAFLLITIARHSSTHAAQIPPQQQPTFGVNYPGNPRLGTLWS